MNELMLETKKFIRENMIEYAIKEVTKELNTEGKPLFKSDIYVFLKGKDEKEVREKLEICLSEKFKAECNINGFENTDKLLNETESSFIKNVLEEILCRINLFYIVDTFFNQNSKNEEFIYSMTLLHDTNNDSFTLKIPDGNQKYTNVVSERNDLITQFEKELRNLYKILHKVSEETYMFEDKVKIEDYFSKYKIVVYQNNFVRDKIIYCFTNYNFHYDFESLVNCELLSKDMSLFLQNLVNKNVNVIISTEEEHIGKKLLSIMSNNISVDKKISMMHKNYPLEFKINQNIDYIRCEEKSDNDLLFMNMIIEPDIVVLDEMCSNDLSYLLKLNTNFITTIKGDNPKNVVEKLIEFINEKSIKNATSHDLCEKLNIFIQLNYVNDKIVISRISEVIGYLTKGRTKNNNWVEEKALDNKFKILQNSPQNCIIQDIFKYDFNTKEFINTGWLPICLNK